MNNLSSITVLYVDDEEINLFLFERTFRKHYNVITATSGEDGLLKLDDHKNEIIVVISDMRMPGMNGIEFIRKARLVHDKIAYFILTGFDYNEEINKALEEKVIHEFFTKPFDIDKIMTAVTNAVKTII